MTLGVVVPYTLVVAQPVVSLFAMSVKEDKILERFLRLPPPMIFGASG